MKNKWKIVGIVIAVIAALYLMPFITVNTTDASGRTWRVPFLSSYVQDQGTQLEFASIRSAYALSKDAANALHTYEEEKCYGKTYYYDAGNDVTFSGYAAAAGFPQSQLTYSYTAGNACAGWTDDDEVAWAYTPLQDVDLNTAVQDAEDAGWFVIQEGVPVNKGVYNDFMRLVKQGVLGYMRTMIVTGGKNSFVDVQFLSDGTFRVLAYDGGSVSDDNYTHLSEKDYDGKTWLTVYNGTYDQEEPRKLFCTE